MKVLVFTTTYPNPMQPTHGVFVQERIARLARRAEVRVVAPYPWFRRGVAKLEERAGLEIRHPTYWYMPRLGKMFDPFFLFLSSLPAVSRLRRRFDFDLIDAHFLYPDGVAASWLAWYFNRPLVITERGTLPQHVGRPIRRAAMRRAMDRAARVIAVSHNLASACVELGASPDKIEVIPNGVDTDRFRPRDRIEARKRLGLPEAGRVLVSVGHLSPRKGFQRVLAVLPELRREFPDLIFAVVGGPGAEGNNGPELRRIIVELDLGAHTILAGAQPPEEVAWWLSAADLFVLATDFEGCPNVVLEAMACGVPVVVSRVGEADRMIPDGAGVLVDDPNNSAELRAKIRDGLIRPWDRGAIRAAMETRTWERVADQVMEQWIRAVASPADSVPRVSERAHS